MGGSDPRVEFLKITKDKISTALREFIADLIDIGIVSEKFYKEVRQKGVSKDLKELANVTHGFVGADLSALAKEAAMIVLRRALPDLKLKEEEAVRLRELTDKLHVQLHKELELIWSSITYANQYVDERKPWVEVKENSDRFLETMTTLVLMIHNITWLLQPFMPETSQKIFDIFGDNGEKEIADGFVFKIKKSKGLFPRLVK